MLSKLGRDESAGIFSKMLEDVYCFLHVDEWWKYHVTQRRRKWESN